MKKALVVGAARSGKYIALLLNDRGYKVYLTDINTVDYKKELQSQNIDVIDNGHPDFLLEQEYSLVVKNPGIKYSVPFIKKLLNKGYRIYSEVDIALEIADKYEVCAITGTNGKTTTTSILDAILNKQFTNSYVGGNIGIPVSEVVYKNGLDKAYLALELSSFQLDGIFNLKPKISNITNLLADHLDYYNSVEDYYLSKQRIYQNQDSSDYFLMNLDDENIKKNLKDIKAKKITYSLKQASDIKIVDKKVFYENNLLFNIDKMKLVGEHNVYNAIVASLMAYFMKVDINLIQDVVENFLGVEHRLEFVDSIDGVSFYNDSKSTNVASTSVALDAFDQKVILLAGGYDKQVSFDKLNKYKDSVKKAILFGQTKEKLANIFEDAILLEGLEDSVKKAVSIAKKGDIVLLSPACASFDQFNDYEERGKAFKTLIEKVKNEKK